MFKKSDELAGGQEQTRMAKGEVSREKSELKSRTEFAQLTGKPQL